MNILIVDSYYPAALKRLRSSFTDLDLMSYSKQLELLHSQHFGTGDAYSYYLSSFGHNAVEIIANDEALQRQWAKENGIKVTKIPLLAKIQSLPYLYRYVGRPSWLQDIIFAQITDFQPEIIYFQDLTVLDPVYLKRIHKHYKLVGQIASKLPSIKYICHFDLILSSLPNLVENISKLGIKCKLFKIGFDTRILDKVGKQKRTYDTVFIGSFSPYHMTGTKMLEQVTRETPIHVWGNGLHFLSPLSPLRRKLHGEAWGIPMYEVLARAKIVVNRHSDIAGEYANNMRMFETTGMGALLITEQKKNISDYFKIGKEIVTYTDTVDLTNKLRYYLRNDGERENIAREGQKKTLKEHTYKMRMKELEIMLKKEL